MSGPINPDYPLRNLGSLDELMGIAVAMEREAASRYEELSAAMRAQGAAELADLFAELAELERDHRDGLGRWAEREGRTLPRVEVGWRLPETFDDAVGIGGLDAYGALRVAVENEERAFVFYTYLAAMADRPDIERRAESLAREELAHLRLLRAMRRRAFHARRGRAEPLPVPRDHDHYRMLADGLDAAGETLEASAARSLRAAGDAAGADLLWHRRPGTADHPPPGVPASKDSVTAALAAALEHAGRAVEFHLAAAERAGDDAMLRDAQGRAEQAIGRLALLRTLMDDHQRRGP